MKRNRFWKTALAVSAIALWCLGSFMAQQAERQTGSVSARWPDGGVSPAQLAKQEEYFRQDGMRNLPEATLWKEIFSQEITDGADNSVECTVVTLYGYAEDVCQDDMIVGGFPIKGDTDGCVISEKLAFDLWGSHDVLGVPVYWDGRSYFVYGIVKSGDSFILMQTDGDSAESFGNMQLRFPDDNSREAAESYLLKAGFMGANLLDLPVMSFFLNLISFIPVFLLAASILIKLIGQGVKLRSLPRLFSLYILPSVLAGTACIVLLGEAQSIPARLIPSKWSDTQFYSNLFNDYAQNIKTWLSVPSSRDLSFFFTLLLSVLFILLTVSFMIASISRMEIRSGRECLFGCLGSIVVIFCMVAILAGGGGLTVGISMWLMPCLWIITDYGLALFRNFLKPGKGTMTHENEKQITE